ATADRSRKKRLPSLGDPGRIGSLFLLEEPRTLVFESFISELCISLINRECHLIPAFFRKIVFVVLVIPGVLEPRHEIIPVLHPLDVGSKPAYPVISGLLDRVKTEIVMSTGGQSKRIVEPGVFGIEPPALVG